MQRRVTSVLAGLVTLSMVVFGQVCALSTLVGPSNATPSELRLQAQASQSGHQDTCTSEACGGRKGESEGSCPGGSAMCCSTWSPPSSRLQVPPPTLFSLAFYDALDMARLMEDEDRAPGVALFNLDRPPGSSRDLLLTSSLSRRGPPASF